MPISTAIEAAQWMKEELSKEGVLTSTTAINKVSSDSGDTLLTVDSSGSKSLSSEVMSNFRTLMACKGMWAYYKDKEMVFVTTKVSSPPVTDMDFWVHKVVPASLIALVFCAVGVVIGWFVGASRSPVVDGLLPLAVGLLTATVTMGGIFKAKSESKESEREPPTGSNRDDRATLHSLWGSVGWAAAVLLFCLGCYVGTQYGIDSRIPTYPPIQALLKKVSKNANANELMDLHRLRLACKERLIDCPEYVQIMQDAVMPLIIDKKPESDRIGNATLQASSMSVRPPTIVAPESLDELELRVWNINQRLIKTDNALNELYWTIVRYAEYVEYQAPTGVSYAVELFLNDFKERTIDLGSAAAPAAAEPMSPPAPRPPRNE